MQPAAVASLDGVSPSGTLDRHAGHSRRGTGRVGAPLSDLEAGNRTMNEKQWTRWRPFPDPTAGGCLHAPIGPGMYDLRRCSCGQLVCCGSGKNAAFWTSTSPTGASRGRYVGVRSSSLGASASSPLAVAQARRRAPRRPISQVDCQIAAIARSRGMALATRRVDGFSDCGIDVIDPSSGG